MEHYHNQTSWHHHQSTSRQISYPESQSPDHRASVFGPKSTQMDSSASGGGAYSLNSQATTPQRPAFPCKVCTGVFQNNSKLKRHYERHHSSARSHGINLQRPQDIRMPPRTIYHRENSNQPAILPRPRQPYNSAPLSKSAAEAFVPNRNHPPALNVEPLFVDEEIRMDPVDPGIPPSLDRHDPVSDDSVVDGSNETTRNDPFEAQILVEHLTSNEPMREMAQDHQPSPPPVDRPIPNDQQPRWLLDSIKAQDKQTPRYPGVQHEAEFKEFLPLFERSGAKKLSPKGTVNGWRPQADLKGIKAFYPSLEMMKSVPEFIMFLDWMGCEAAGAAKFTPPPEWTPRPEGYADFDLMFTAVRQIPHPAPPIKKTKSQTGNKPIYQPCVINFDDSDTTEYSMELFYKEYHKSLIEAMQVLEDNDLKDDFWKYTYRNTALYAKDLLKTAFHPSVKAFNLDKLDTWMTMHGDFKEGEGGGLIRSYVYVSHFLSCFTEHVEDFGLYSINYNHLGWAKFWRIISPSFAYKYIALLQKIHKNQFKEFAGCAKFCMHKQFLVPDNILDEHGIPYSWVKQEAGSFIVTWPMALHSGFASGFSLGEAVNFCVHPSWVPYAICYRGCRRQPRCLFGKNTSKSPLPWIKAGLSEEDYKKYLNGKLEIVDPCLLPHEPKIIPVPFEPPTTGTTAKKQGPNKGDALPVYPFNLEDETEEEGLQLRHFYKTPEDIPDDEVVRALIQRLSNLKLLKENAESKRKSRKRKPQSLGHAAKKSRKQK